MSAVVPPVGRLGLGRLALEAGEELRDLRRVEVLDLANGAVELGVELLFLVLL